MTTMTTAAGAKPLCTNCEHDVVGVYCARCGERQPDHHDLTLGHFLHHVLHEFAHLDGKIFASLKLLFTKPGALTVEYFAGRKSRYVAPLRLFLTGFALMLVLYSIRGTRLHDFGRYMAFDTTGSIARNVDRIAAREHVTREEIVERINEHWEHNVHLLEIVNIVGVALTLWVLYFGGRRHLVEHIVFAAHYLAFVFLVNALEWPVYHWIGLELTTAAKTMSATVTLLLIVYLYLSMRRYYGQGKLKTGIKAVFAYFGVFLTYGFTFMMALAIAFFQVA